jgi:hypothetical protein
MKKIAVRVSIASLGVAAAALTVSGLMPVQASAATAHVPVSASAPHVTQVPREIYPGWIFYGVTYPESEGAACADRGEELVRSGRWQNYQCRFDEPTKGRIGLYVYGIEN